MRFLIVFLAGGLGCAARLGVATLIGTVRPFPYATLTVNVVGSFLMALIFGIAQVRVAPFSEHMKLAMTTGFMGGFTTYSTFNFETLELAQTGHSGRAALNVAVTLAGCILAGLAGLWLARRLT